MRGRDVATLVVLAAALIAAHGLLTGWLAVPDDYNPWAELDPTVAPNPLTSMKLRRAHEDPARCYAALTQLEARYASVPDRQAGPECGFRDALRLSGLGAAKLQPSVILSCRTALSFGMWQRHAVQPAAEAHLGTTVVSIRNLGSYACRDVNTGEPSPQRSRRSRHATADAIDIGSFVLGDGRSVTVERDWQRSDAAAQPDASTFLHAAHAGACRFFDGVLGPDYNAVHRDHFHLEDGGWRACR